MRDQNTNEFTYVQSNRASAPNYFIVLLAILFAIVAIGAAIMLSIILNTPPATPPVNTDTTQPNQTTAPDSSDTTVPADTTTPNTQHIIIPPTNTTDTTTKKQDPPKNPPTGVNGKYTICIDPGHGYDDPGTFSDYLGTVTERDIVMDISNYLKDILVDYGFNIVMTHEDNIPPAGTYGQYLFNPRTRIAYANEKFDYDYYISVHCNSFQQSYVNGTRIYYHAPSGANNAEITKVAEHLKNGIGNAIPTSKTPSLHPLDTADAYYVCRYAESLATMLVETGFVTNESDAKKMLDENWKKAMAQGIADGINSYFSTLK